MNAITTTDTAAAGLKDQGRQASTGTKGSEPKKKGNPGDLRGGGWFIAPFMVLYLVFTVVPVIYGFGMSFFNLSLTGGGSEFIGFGNYRELIGDAQVWRTLWHTLLFTLLSTVPLVVVSLVMALLVHTGVGGQWLWRFSFFAPFLLPVATVVLVWQWLFQNDFGILNSLLKAFGLEGVGWTTDANMTMWSVVIVTVWWTVGFNFLLYLSALQAIPDTVMEASAIDGATGFRRLGSIVLPLLKPTTGLVVMLQVLASLKVFDQIFILYGGSGGPGGNASPILEYVYNTGFVGYRLGYASAISYLLFFIIIVISVVHYLVQRRRSNLRNEA